MSEGFQLSALTGCTDYLVAVDEQVKTTLRDEYMKYDYDVRDIMKLACDDIQRLFSAGGKRIRPALAYIGYLAGGGSSICPKIVSLGAAIEFLHCAALLHDDLIDEAQLRRGMRALNLFRADEHRKLCWKGDSDSFGYNSALLTGLLSEALADMLMVDMPRDVVSGWSEVKQNMIAGEYCELVASAKGENGPEISRTVARLKTSSYTVVGPLALGVQLAGAPDLVSQFVKFGNAVGEAFQVRDDIIDSVASSGTVGKTTGNDARLFRPTALASHEIVGDRVSISDDASIAGSKMSVGDVGDPVSARQRAEGRIEELVEQAVLYLSDLDIPIEVKNALQSFAREISYRGNYG